MSLLDRLDQAGLRRGGLLALTVAGHGDRPVAGLAFDGGQWPITALDPAAVAAVDTDLRPRWVCWSSETALELTRAGVRLTTGWDLVAVHRLLFGGWRADPARIWASLHELSAESLPGTGQLDLLGAHGEEGVDPEEPVRPDGHLRPEWTGGGWRRDPDRCARWAGIALAACRLQQRRLALVDAAGHPMASAHAESTAELLCAELSHDGLPIDLARARELIASFVGPPPVDAEDAARQRERRDAAVLRLVPTAEGTDLRNPGQVRAMLARVGIEVPDTRSWRLENFRGAHPVIEALLGWRKAERIATTYGYEWLERNVGADGRLRGAWSGSDGAAGRMTASAGLHNLLADLRPAVAAGDGQVFVRADLGQIEPRVLAAVSGDRALGRASAEDDLSTPIAAKLRVERPVA
ncbi:MAG: DNA polymerase, partial [Jatrophihabitans sp.]